MKGGNYHRFRGRHFSLTLVALFLTTILLWAWEKNPPISTRLLAQDPFAVSSSEEEHIKEKYSHSMTKEDLKIPVKNFGALPLDFTVSVPPERKDQDGDQTSFSRSIDIKEPVENFVDSHEAVTTSFPPERDDRDGDKKSISRMSACNYAKGRWVADSRGPLYSGFGCKRWLSEMWACRLTQRTDFSYEGYRWQPDKCDIPDFERFAFLRRMQDKTLAFIGDSLGRQQFQSMMCMATGGEDSPEVEDVGWKYGLVKHHGAKRPDGWAYYFPKTNTTILYYWSSTLADLEPLNVTDPATNIAMHLDRPPAFMRRFLHQFDVLVLNTGHHWNRGKLNANRWVIHVNGKPNEDRRLAPIGNAKNFTVYSVARWLDSKLPFHPRLKVFFRTISPRHFHNGDWNTGGHCDNTVPLTGGSEVLQDKSSDDVVEGAVKDTKVKILDITAISELRDEGHVSRYSITAAPSVNDCLHWCLPGIPDTWNELLAAQI